MRYTLASMLALVALLPAAQAETKSKCPIAGTYGVSGQGARGELYHGEATISDNGIGCYIKWGEPNNSEGTGKYSHNTLTVNFSLDGDPGIVSYKRQSTGELRGVWWMESDPDQKGKESLFPKSLAAQ